MCSSPRTPEMFGVDLKNEVDNVKTDDEKNDDDILVLITAEFDTNAITNIENHFQKDYSELIGKSVTEDGLKILFFESEDKIEYTISFEAKVKFEMIGETKAKILDFIYSWDGKIVE